MTKKSRKHRVRATNSPNLVGRNMIMTDEGEVPIEVARAARASGGAVHQPQLMNLSGQSLPPRRGTRELLSLYAESPWLRAIVGKIGRAVAETDWLLYAQKDVAGRYVKPEGLVSRAGNVRDEIFKRELDKGTVDVVHNHPLLDLLENGTGNARLNGFAALMVTQEHIDLTGEGFWLLEPDALGVPVAFWPIPPSWVTNFPNGDKPFYELNIPGGARVNIPSTMIIPFIDPDPANPYGRGTGIAKSLDDEIQIDEFAAKHSKSFFLNRARPDIIVSGQFISPKDAERLEKQWLSDHQGFWKSFKPLFFSQKIDVKELSHTFENLQMVQVRKHERDTFISVFGAPPEKFGIIGESKRSTINAADYFWNKDLIKPRVEMFRRILQTALVPRYDERLLLYYDTPVLQDEEFKLNAMRQAPFASTINEWRKVQGQETLGTAGDVLVIPLNHMLIPVKDLNGNSLNSDEVVEESVKQRAAHGNLPIQENQIETKTIIDEVVREVATLVDGALSTLGKSRD